MRIIKSLALLLVCAGGQLPVTAYAQNPFIIFVESQPNATALHIEVANAVAAICPNLGGFGQPAGPQRDLFLRCNEMIATVSQALLKVAPKYRQVLTLRIVWNLSNGEIAQREGIPVATARTQLRRGREELRKHLAPMLRDLGRTSQ